MSAGAWLALAWCTLPMPGPAPESWWTSQWPAFPTAALVERTRELPVTWHDRADWRLATFLETAPEGDPLPVPRLVLEESVYVPGATVDELPVDGAENLLAASLEGALALEADLREEVRRRSLELVPAWPAEAGEASLRTALAELGAHSLSLGLEVRRAAERLRDRGVDPCELARSERLIFSLWRPALDPAGYVLRHPVTGGSGGVRLRSDDRDWVLGDVLGVRWTGRVAEDLDLGCAPPQETRPGSR